MLLRIAWRNIWRSRNRSLVIMASIGLGLWAALFITAFYNGTVEQRIRSAIDIETAHIQVHHPYFPQDMDLQYSLPAGQEMADTIAAMPATAAVSARVVVQGMVASASGSAGVTIIGVDPTAEKTVSGLYRFVREGSYLRSTANPEVLISTRLMKKLKLSTGSKLILTITDAEGNLSSGAYRIVGAYETVNAPLDESRVFISVRDAAAMAGLGSAVNELAIRLQSDETTDAQVTMLRRRWPGVLVEGWAEINPEMQFLVASFDTMMLVYMAIILLALAFGIVNTMMMAVLERTREIGMLLSLGMNKARVFAMISLETLFLVLAGCPAGLLAALLTIRITGKTGIRLSAFSKAFSSFGYSDLVFPSITLRQFLLLMVLVVCTAIMAGLFPARKALSLKPAEAIRK